MLFSSYEFNVGGELINIFFQKTIYFAKAVSNVSFGAHAYFILVKYD